MNSIAASIVAGGIGIGTVGITIGILDNFLKLAQYLGLMVIMIVMVVGGQRLFRKAERDAKESIAQLMKEDQEQQGLNPSDR